MGLKVSMDFNIFSNDNLGQYTVLNLTKYVSMHFDVSIGKIKTLKPFISMSSNLVILLILMPRFQILHFPGPEMAGLLKNCS